MEEEIICRKFFFAFIITIEGIVALSIGYFFHIEASEMPKLDSDITQFFPTLSYRTATDPRACPIFFQQAQEKCAGEKGTEKLFDYSDIKRCFDYLSS